MKDDLAEDVPDQRKAQLIIDSRHEYTAWFYRNPNPNLNPNPNS